MILALSAYDDGASEELMALRMLFCSRCGSGPCRVLKDTCHERTWGGWLWSPVVLRDRAALKIQGSADCCSPAARNSLLCMYHRLFLHTDVFRNNSADVNSYTFVCCVFFFFFKASEKGNQAPLSFAIH